MHSNGFQSVKYEVCLACCGGKKQKKTKTFSGTELYLNYMITTMTFDVDEHSSYSSNL